MSDAAFVAGEAPSAIPAVVSLLSVPVAMAGAVTLSVGLHHLWLHFRRPNRTDLWFALTCLSMVGYDLASAILYSASSLENGAACQRAQFVSITLTGYAFIHFVEAYASLTLPRWLRIASLAFPIGAVVGTFERFGWLLREGVPNRYLSHTPFGHFTYQEVAIGPLFQAFEAAVPLLAVYVFWASRTTRGRPELARREKPLLLAGGLLLAGIGHDVLVAHRSVPGLYLTEYAWFGVVVLMSATRSREVLEASGMRMMLASTNQRYATTLDAILDAVITTDTAGKVVHLNPAAERLLAAPRARALGTPLSELVEIISAETNSVVKDPVHFAVGRPSNPYGELPQLVTTDGSERRVDVGGAPLRTPEGRVEGAVVVIKDLTVQHHAIETLRHAKKMESMGQLAGGVAHDLNNLLTPILSYVELLQRGAPEGSDEALFLGYIQEAAHRAAGVTRHLLALSRKQVLDVQVVPMAELVRKTVPLVRQLVGEDITVELDLSDDAGAARVDPSQMEQVVLNLASNARDAMPHGGTIKLTVRRTTDSELTLEVKDTGVGMSDATLDRIFEPFFTTKPRGKGTGLGLASVRGIVEQHGGAVFVDSELGVGTSFEVVLPVASGEEPAPSSRALPESAAARGSECVLVVEDDRSVRTLVFEALSQLGYTVHVADGLVTAEAVARSEHLDLLITDVVMPGADGPKVKERVRSHQDIPCLFITGHADGRLGERGFVDRGTEVLRKPFTVTQLAERVRRVLDAGRTPAADTPRRR